MGTRACGEAPWTRDPTESSAIQTRVTGRPEARSEGEAAFTGQGQAEAEEAEPVPRVGEAARADAARPDPVHARGPGGRVRPTAVRAALGSHLGADPHDPHPEQRRHH